MFNENENIIISKYKDVIVITMVGTKKISISINEELKNAIDILADGEGVSRSRLIESILINNKCRKG